MAIEREQALAFRVAGQNLHERTDPLTAVAACGLQEAPPGWSPVALHARAEGSLDPDQVVLVNAMRGSPHLVPVRDVRVFTEALVPDDAGLKVLVLRDGVLAALWKGRKRKDVLDVELEWLAEPADMEGELQVVARLRGCESARVQG